MEYLLPPNKACGRELTQCLRIMCGPKNCSGPLLPVLAEAPPRSGVMRASTFSPFPNVGQTWTIVHSMPTSYQPIGLCLDFLPLAYLAFSQCGPDMLNLCHLIVPAYFVDKSEVVLKISQYCVVLKPADLLLQKPQYYQ